MEKKLCVIVLCMTSCPVYAQDEIRNIPSQQSPKVQQATCSCGFNPGYAEQMLGKGAFRKIRRQPISPTRLEPIPDNR